MPRARASDRHHSKLAPQPSHNAVEWSPKASHGDDLIMVDAEAPPMSKHDAADASPKPIPSQIPRSGRAPLPLSRAPQDRPR